MTEVDKLQKQRLLERREQGRRPICEANARKVEKMFSGKKFEIGGAMIQLD